jgi:hypothetical protein
MVVQKSGIEDFAHVEIPGRRVGATFRRCDSACGDGSVKRRVRQRRLELTPRLATPPLDDIPDTSRVGARRSPLARRSPMLAPTQPP